MQKMINIGYKNHKSLTDNTDIQISYFIISYYYVQMLNLFVKTVLPIPEIYYSKISIMFGIILIIFFAKSIWKVLRRSAIPFVVTETLFLGVFFISLLMGNAEKSLLINSLVWTLIICIPLGIYVYSIKNTKIFYDLFIKHSITMTIICLLMLFFSSKDSQYSISFSYALLVPSIFHLNEWFNYKRKMFLILFITEMVGILMYGSRGPLISIICFLLIRFIISEKNIIKKSFISLTAVITVMALYYNLEKIGLIILRFLEKKGYYSRTLIILFTNRITYDSGRFDLFNYYLKLVAEKPIVGWGVFGGWLNKSLGPHNIIIEIMLAFGVVIGGLIIILLLFSQLRVFYVNDKSTKDLILIYMSICIVLYFISGNFLEKPDFFIFVGLILNSFKNKSVSEGKI